MNYDIDNLVLDFARRTRKNLEYIESCSRDADSQVYEFTQLINSLLGLLVFPKEKFWDNIPKKSLAELVAEGWPAMQPVEDWLEEDYLRQLVRTLRNGIVHFNLEFTTNAQNELSGVRIWNGDKDKPTWKAKLTTEELKIIVDKFIEIIESMMKPQASS